MHILNIAHVWKDLLLLATRLIGKIPDPRNAKEHYQSFIRKKHTINKTIKSNYSVTKSSWKSKHCWYKISYYRTSKNWKSFPSIVIQKSEYFLNEKNGLKNSSNAENLNYFDPEIQLKDTESTIKIRLNKLLTKLWGFKFVTSPVLVLKKIESEDKTKCDTFYSHSKAKTIINQSAIDYNVFKSIYTTVISSIQNF